MDKNHPGAFGYKRKFDHHAGVDLYCDMSYIHNPVYAVETGVVVAIENFTGPGDKSPWWNDTQCVMIEGASGVVNYGEIRPLLDLAIGQRVLRGEEIGIVIPVLKEGKERPDIPGHSRLMLHMELYEHGTRTPCGVWEHDGEIPKGILDPTQHLLSARGIETKILEL